MTIKEEIKNIDTKKMWEEMRVRANISKEKWEKMTDGDRFNAAYGYVEHSNEPDSMDKADKWYDGQQDKEAVENFGK